jgi:hypothetical protein
MACIPLMGRTCRWSWTRPAHVWPGVDVSYAAAQAHKVVKVALHREYSPGIIFIFSQGRKDLCHV